MGSNSKEFDLIHESVVEVNQQRIREFKERVKGKVEKIARIRAKIVECEEEIENVKKQITELKLSDEVIL